MKYFEKISQILPYIKRLIGQFYFLFNLIHAVVKTAFAVKFFINNPNKY